MESYANYQLHFSILYTSESMSAINIPGKFHANRQNKRASFQTRTYSTDLPEQIEQFQKADVLNCSFIENFKDTNSSVFTKLQIHFTNQRTKQTRQENIAAAKCPLNIRVVIMSKCLNPNAYSSSY